MSFFDPNDGYDHCSDIHGVGGGSGGRESGSGGAGIGGDRNSGINGIGSGRNSSSCSSSSVSSQCLTWSSDCTVR